MTLDPGGYGARRDAESAEKKEGFRRGNGVVFSAFSASLRAPFLFCVEPAAQTGQFCQVHPNDITREIVDAAYNIHLALGPGLFESVYEAVLYHELRKRGLKGFRQVAIPIAYDGLQFDEGFRADLVVENSVIVELKSTEMNHPIHPKQLRTHLVLAKLQLGLVLNFGLPTMKEGITRVVNGLPDANTAEGPV